MRAPRTLGTLLLISAALITACRDVAGEAPDVSVRVWVIGTEAPIFHTAPDSSPWISCDAYLAAQATGTGEARWRGATFRYFTNAAPSVPFDSIVLSAAEMGESWQNEALTAGQTLHAHTPVAASIPFHVTVEFHYRTDAAKEKHASATISCGERQGDSTAVPTITSFDVASSSPDLEPGGTLTVTYSASSPFGLWETVVALSGPCQFERRFTEKLALSVERTIAVRLPSSCILGGVPRVGVSAIDGRVQTTARSLQLSSQLVDRTRPSIGTAFIQIGTLEDEGVLAGALFVGQTLHLKIVASDNHKLRSLTWEVPSKALRDSVMGADSVLTRELSFKATDDMIGPFEMRYHARDAVGLVSDTVATMPGALRIYPTVTRAVREGLFPSPLPLVKFVFDDIRGVLFAEELGSLYIHPLDSVGIANPEPLEMPQVRGLDISPGGDSLLTVVPDLQSLAIVDLRTASRSVSYVRLDSLAVDPDMRVYDLRMVKGGRVFILIWSMAHGNRLLEVSLATGAQRWHDELGFSLVGEYMLRTPDHTKLFVADGACMWRFDSGVGAFGGCLPRPGSLPTTSDLTGKTFAAGDSIYDGSWTFLRRVTRPSAPIMRPVLTPDGRELFYLVEYAGLVRSDATNGQLLDRSPLVHVADPPGQLFVTRDGTRVVSVRDDIDGTKVSVVTVR